MSPVVNMILSYRHTDILSLLYKDLTGKEGDNGLFITLVPKLFNNVFLFLGSTALGTFNEFGLFDSLACPNVSTRRRNYFRLSSLGMYINVSSIFLSLSSLRENIYNIKSVCLFVPTELLIGPVRFITIF